MKLATVVLNTTVALLLANAAAAAVIGPGGGGGGGGGGGTSSGICGGSGLEGAAEGYNVLIVGHGDFTATDASTQGNLAVGGDAHLTEVTVAADIVGSSAEAVNPATLVLGGRLTAEGGGVGSNLDGAIYTDTKPWLQNFTAKGGTFEQTLVDFGTAAHYYEELAATLASQPVTGTTDFTAATSESGATLSFTGSVAAGLNVFSVEGTELSAASSITISAPAGSAVIVNVKGPFAKFRSGKVVETGVSAAAVIYNFYEAALITLAGSEDLEGSVLAPFAQVAAEAGQLHGQVVAASFYGKMQFQSAPFACTLPTPSSSAPSWPGSGGHGCNGKKGWK